MMEHLPERPRLTGEEKVRAFQRKIYQKAKEEKQFRFYSLYDKVHSINFLREAYRRVKKNKGAPGVDGMTFESIEKEGVEVILSELQSELKTKTYKPSAVKRRMIPKANGKMRPLGIPTIKDRIAQMSCKMAIEPIFEADFEDSSYGFRPKRSAADAVGKIKEHLKKGKTKVLDADLSAYFDTIPHSKLLTLIGLRISDGRIMHLIKLWLKSPVEEENGKMSGGKKNKVGTPQGGVISPLLAIIYLHLVDKLVMNNPLFRGVEIVRYADDFVLLGWQHKERALAKLKDVLRRMELSLNEEKTSLLDARKRSFNFLGFTFRYDRCLYDEGNDYLNICPSEKALKALRGKVKKTLRDNIFYPDEILVKKINPILRGWFNYFDIKGVSYSKMAKNKMKFFLYERLNRHQKRKSQRYRRVYCQNTFNRWVDKLGLYNPDSSGKIPLNA